jgi:hypothetical protein
MNSQPMKEKALKESLKEKKEVIPYLVRNLKKNESVLDSCLRRNDKKSEVGHPEFSGFVKKVSKGKQ